MTRSTITALLAAVGLAVGAAPAAAADDGGAARLYKSEGEYAVHVGMGNGSVAALTEEDDQARWIGPCSPRAGVTSCRVVVRSATTRCTAVARAKPTARATVWDFWLSHTRCTDLKATTRKETRRG